MIFLNANACALQHNHHLEHLSERSRLDSVPASVIESDVRVSLSASSPQRIHSSHPDNLFVTKLPLATSVSVDTAFTATDDNFPVLEYQGDATPNDDFPQSVLPGTKSHLTFVNSASDDNYFLSDIGLPMRAMSLNSVHASQNQELPPGNAGWLTIMPVNSITTPGWTTLNLDQFQCIVGGSSASYIMPAIEVDSAESPPEMSAVNCSVLASSHLPVTEIANSVSPSEISVGTHSEITCASVPELAFTNCDESEVDNSSKQETGINVKSTNNVDSHRVRNKKFLCIYCSCEVLQLPRHLYAAHSEETEVAEMLACKDRNKRAALMTKLRNMGGHKNNLNAVRKCSGNLRVAYRPTHEICVREKTFVPCSHCYGWYRREQLWRHVQRCKVASVDTRIRRPLRAADMVLNSGSHETVSAVISGMHKDAVYMAVKEDALIHDLIRMLMSKTGNSNTHINYVRSHVRNLGRLLLKMRAAVPELQNAAIREMIAPHYFSTIVSAARELAGCDSGSYTPSTGVNLGHDLNFCAEMVKTLSLMEGNVSAANLAENFEAVMKSRWKYEISGGARRELQKRSFNKPFLLPLTNDVMKLTSYLKDQQAEASSVVSGTEQGDFCSEFRRLADMTLAQVILFNRRRQGEVSKMTTDIYRLHAQEANTITSNPEVEQLLSPVEKQLSHLFSRIEIPGKRHRCVPVLLTAEMRSAMDLLVDNVLRERAGIEPANVFVFALGKGSVSHIRGHDILEKTSKLCGAEKPNLLRSTNLRKHIATMSQILNLKNNELDQLAQFMGHDIRIHREYYRLPNDVVQTAQVVKVLMSMEAGTIGHWRGKSLNEIDVSSAVGEQFLTVTSTYSTTQYLTRFVLES